MTRNMRLFASASVLATAALAATPAWAAGTTAGTVVTNNVSLTYKVGGVDQTAVTTSDSFKVDRKVNLTVVEAAAGTVSVSPGQQSVITAFDVTNASNAKLDFTLGVTQLDGGTAAHGGTDNFDVTGVTIFVDTNDNDSFDSGTDQQLSYLDEIAADDTKRVFVRVNVPLGRSTADVAGIRLTATAAEADTVGSAGAAVTQTTGANTINVDTVFADGNTGGNVARDGAHFAEDDFTVFAAALTAAKTSRVISDPFNNTTNPKMIPGAVVEYCVAVSNAADSATASNVSISDTVPANTSYLAAFGIKINGTLTGSTCNADGASGGTYSAGVVSATLDDIDGGSAKTLVFRVTVN